MSIAQEKIRRLAHRGINVLGRAKERSPVLAGFASTYQPQAERYIELYDAQRMLRQANRRDGADGRDAIDQLVTATRSWSYLVRTNAPGYEHREFGDSSGVPEDVIADAEAFLLAVGQLADAGVELPFLEALRADMTARLDVARQDWASSADSVAALRDHQREIRRMQDRLQAELVSLRRVLALELGTAHPDYQKLRLTRASVPDLDDDLAIEPGDPSGDELDALDERFESVADAAATAEGEADVETVAAG